MYNKEFAYKRFAEKVEAGKTPEDRELRAIWAIEEEENDEEWERERAQTAAICEKFAPLFDKQPSEMSFLYKKLCEAREFGDLRPDRFSSRERYENAVEFMAAMDARR